MELAANIWPVVDAQTGFVQRYFLRAYAVGVSDELIGVILKALAPTDFRLAKSFAISAHFSVHSEHGQLAGTMPVSAFHENLGMIVSEALRETEKDYLKMQGVSLLGDEPEFVNVIPRFSQDPYTLTTALLETLEGELFPQVPGNSGDA